MSGIEVWFWDQSEGAGARWATTPEKSKKRKSCGMFGIHDRFRVRRMLSTKASRSCTTKYWLPGMDSNHDSRLQRPLSYH